MKYLTHLTIASEDDKHEELRERMGRGVSGLAAYGLYWIVAEKIGAQIRKESVSTSLRKPWSKWAEIGGVKTSWIRKWGRTAHEVGLIRLQDEGQHATIDMPNLLKYADEYSRKVGIKSGQTPDKLRSDSGIPAVQQSRHTKDLKPGSVDNSAPCGILTGASAAGGVLEAPPAAAPANRQKPKIEDPPGRMTEEELIEAARLTGRKMAGSVPGNER